MRHSRSRICPSASQICDSEVCRFLFPQIHQQARKVISSTGWFKVFYLFYSINLKIIYILLFVNKPNERHTAHQVFLQVFVSSEQLTRVSSMKVHLWWCSFLRPSKIYQTELSSDVTKSHLGLTFTKCLQLLFLSILYIEKYFFSRCVPPHTAIPHVATMLPWHCFLGLINPKVKMVPNKFAVFYLILFTEMLTKFLYFWAVFQTNL